MKKFSNLLLIALVVSIFAICSCTKSKQEKIENSWRLIRVKIDSTVNWYESWKFENDMVHMLKENTITNSMDTLYTAKYTVEAGLSKTIVSFEECEEPLYNGNWEIIKLNKEILVMLNKPPGDFVYREFVKE